MFVFSINAFASTFDKVEEVIEREYGIIEIGEEVPLDVDSLRIEKSTAGFDFQHSMVYRGESYASASIAQKLYLTSTFYWKSDRRNEVKIENETSVPITFKYKYIEGVSGTPKVLMNSENDKTDISFVVSPKSSRTIIHPVSYSNRAYYVATDCPITSTDYIYISLNQ